MAKHQGLRYASICRGNASGRHDAQEEATSSKASGVTSHDNSSLLLALKIVSRPHFEDKSTSKMLFHGILRCATDYLGSKIFVTICLFLLAIQLYFISHTRVHDFNPTSIYTHAHSQQLHTFSGFHNHGNTPCLPEISQQLVDASITKHAMCRKHSPFVTGRGRISLVTAHFGVHQAHYEKAFETHLLHSLIHGTEVHVMCNAIVDDLWNKPAFLLNLVMHEMMKPEDKRLEWIMWVDRDTVILDQCRPIASFLPPEPSRYAAWWNHSNNVDPNRTNQSNLLVNNDLNGLNNGVFLLRVNSWAIEFFNTILAFRHYNPDVELVFTEQSAMEKVINDENFKDHVKFVPQHWFNGYPAGQPALFRDRTDENGLGEEHVRRGDYLVHFAGNPKKDEAINGWLDMLRELPDVWEHGTVQRDVSNEVREFWTSQGY
ncbi:hypothetical protein J1614_011291 [Plenodomus biglobosus]|nr:hypothetical protein J1614_011291 [Plenodomus biglobosus]